MTDAEKKGLGTLLYDYASGHSDLSRSDAEILQRSAAQYIWRLEQEVRELRALSNGSSS